MSQMRQNPFTGEWTLYAENRKNRPYEFVHHMKPKSEGQETCPFCGGHEAWTTKAIYQDGENENWQIRVFPNMFPAVTQEWEVEPKEPFYAQVPGRGSHEVLVDTPLHRSTIDQFSAEQIEKILTVLQERHKKIKERDETAYVQIFKNCGPSAGMSIRHSHWQLLGLPILPERIRAMAAHVGEEHCLFCEMLAYEKEAGERIAFENEDFLALAPYASRFPYELWIFPKRHISNYELLTEKERKGLGEILWNVLQRLVCLKEEIGYNICLIDSPKGQDFHWHLEIFPRIGGFAGFEYATNSYINSIFPEKAVAFYKKEQN